MADQEIKVLQIAGGFRANVNGQSVSGGVASFLRSYCTKIQDRTIHFDFMSLRNQCFEPYRKELEAIGGTLYCLDLQTNGFKRAYQLIKRLSVFLKKGSYNAVHINMGSFFPSLCCAIAARHVGIKTIIVHSHSSGIYSKRKRFIADLFKPILLHEANKYCACSLVAAQNLYPQRAIDEGKIIMIKNAVDTDKFRFNKDVRKARRQELNIANEIVFGHVGRFVEVKNHRFLIDVFEEIKKRNSNVKLILVGEGELREDIQKKVSDRKLSSDIIFLGHRNNVHEYLQAMDVFILPSTVEGFPISALEAQAAGLPCYISDNISQEVELCETCKHFSLANGSVQLADAILKDLEDIPSRIDTSEIIQKAGYDLKDNVNTFISLYKGGN